MFAELRAAMTRHQETLVADFAGCAALAVILFAGLMLPALA